jgi:hypothetical protein
MKKIKSLQLTSPMIFSPDDLVNNVGGRVLVRGKEKKTIFDLRNTEQKKPKKRYLTLQHQTDNNENYRF